MSMQFHLLLAGCVTKRRSGWPVETNRNPRRVTRITLDENDRPGSTNRWQHNRRRRYTDAQRNFIYVHGLHTTVPEPNKQHMHMHSQTTLGVDTFNKFTVQQIDQLQQFGRSVLRESHASEHPRTPPVGCPCTFFSRGPCLNARCTHVIPGSRPLAPQATTVPTLKCDNTVQYNMPITP